MNMNKGHKANNHGSLLRLLMALLFLFINGNLFAIDFEVNGILYTTSNNTNNNVKVTGKNKSYSGAITIPETVLYQGTIYAVTSIGEDAFYGDKSITSIVIPQSITFIDESAFWGCENIEAVYISSIDSWINITFDNSSGNPLHYAHHLYVDGIEVNDIVIPEGITLLDDYAFTGFVGLKSVTLPSTLEGLSREFRGCANLEKVISKSITPPGIEDKVSGPFDNISPNAILQVPKGCKSNYLASNYWNKTFKEIIEESVSFNLSITAYGNGSVSYNGITIRGNTSSFTVNEGTSATITFTPDSGYRIASVKVNNTDVTSSVSNNKYTISNIKANTTMEVVFGEEINTVTIDNITYYLNHNEKTAEVTFMATNDGRYTVDVVIPTSINNNGTTYSVTSL